MIATQKPPSAARYLVLVQLDSASPIRRVADDAPGIIALIKSCSTGESVQALRSNDGVLFGFFIKSDLPENVILSRFDASDHTTNKDAILITPVDNRAVSSPGFSRVSTWLTRH